MNIRAIAVVLLALTSWNAHAQSGASEVLSSVVVPVVGSTEGISQIHWRTDVTLRNDLRSEIDVALILPTVRDQPAIITTIPPGQTIRFSDVIGEAFGMTSVLSPLLVQTRGRRSVAVSAVAYGTSRGEVVVQQPIAVNYAGSYAPQRVLHGLSFSDSFRTNIGLANLGDREASFTLALQRLPGRNLAVTRIRIPPLTLWHYGVSTFFPLITSGTDFSVIVETSDPDTYVYASVIHNTTADARFVPPAFGLPQQQVATARE